MCSHPARQTTHTHTHTYLLWHMRAPTKSQFFTEIVDSAGMDEYSRLSRNASVSAPRVEAWTLGGGGGVVTPMRWHHLGCCGGSGFACSGTPSASYQVGVHGYLLLYAINSRNSFEKIQVPRSPPAPRLPRAPRVLRRLLAFPQYLSARRVRMGSRSTTCWWTCTVAPSPWRGCSLAP